MTMKFISYDKVRDKYPEIGNMDVEIVSIIRFGDMAVIIPGAADEYVDEIIYKNKIK